MVPQINQNIKNKLQEEHNFSFNRQGIPASLKPLLDEIEHNKRKWKSLYMAVWGLPLYHLKPNYINQNRGDELIPWRLPAAKLEWVLYTPKELTSYLESYDKSIHISQVINIFTLLENYFFEYHKVTKSRIKEKISQKILKQILNSSFIKSISKKNNKIKSLIDKTKNKFNIKKRDFTYINVLKKYLKKKKFATKKELIELEFAKETRNSFIHRRGLINKNWLKIYKKTSRKKQHHINDDIPLDFHDLENWTDMMVKIVENSIKVF